MEWLESPNCSQAKHRNLHIYIYIYGRTADYLGRGYELSIKRENEEGGETNQKE